MKKNLFSLIIPAIIFSNVSASGDILNPSSKDLHDAIKSVDYKKVESILQNQTLSQLEKNKLLELANDSIKLWDSNSQSLSKSSNDKLKVILGCALLPVGLITACSGPTLIPLFKFFQTLKNKGISLHVYNQFSVDKRRGIVNEVKDSIDEKDIKKMCALGLLGACIGIGGVYSIIQGMNKTSAKNKLKVATQIKTLIEDIKIKS